MIIMSNPRGCTESLNSEVGTDRRAVRCAAARPAVAPYHQQDKKIKITMVARFLRGMLLCLWIGAAHGAEKTSKGYERWKAERKVLLEDKSVIAYYDFQDESDSIVKNWSKLGGALDGAIDDDAKVHGPAWGLGRWPGKKALQFDPGLAPTEGPDGDVPSACFVEISPEKQMYPLDKSKGGTGEMTFELWFKVSTLEGGWMGLVDRVSGGSATSSPYVLWCNSGHVALFVCRLPDGKDVQVGDNESLVKGKWAHVAVTITADRCALYRDGRLCGEAKLPGLPSDNEKPLLIGAYGRQIGLFHGWVDEMVIYNRALTEEEIQKRAALAPEETK